MAPLCLLSWGLAYGIGFGAGLGYTFHACQRCPDRPSAVVSAQAGPVGQVQRAARPKDKLRVATCQFPVNASIAANATSIREFMRQAADAGAHLLHTSEASLTGYPGSDIPSFQEPYSHWASFIARPDATIPKQLERNQPGILIHDFPDGLSEGGWYHNFQPMKLRPDEIMTWGTPSQHPRQADGQAEP